MDRPFLHFSAASAMGKDHREYTELLQVFKGQGHFSYQQRVADNIAEFLPKFKGPIKVPSHFLKKQCSNLNFLSPFSG